MCGPSGPAASRPAHAALCSFLRPPLEAAALGLQPPSSLRDAPADTLVSTAGPALPEASLLARALLIPRGAPQGSSSPGRLS